MFFSKKDMEVMPVSPTNIFCRSDFFGKIFNATVNIVVMTAVKAVRSYYGYRGLPSCGFPDYGKTTVWKYALSNNPRLGDPG